MRNPKFHKLLEEIAKLHDMKNSDYATTKDPFSNFRECVNIGIPAWKGCLVRISDKWSRIKQLANKPPAVKTENIIDTLKDMATYCLICVLLFEEENKSLEIEK